MRKKIVIGNWKMNTNIEEAINLIVDLKEGLGDNATVICVPFTHIGIIQEIVDDRIAVGAQNICKFENGAYTGEISGSMLQSLGAEFVIIGHSERRKHFHETDETVNEKVKVALSKDIIPIICCGESLDLRNSNEYLPFIKNQINKALLNIDAKDVVDCIIAYEPIWAIGTGKTASAVQAEEVHDFIRKEIAKLYNEECAAHISIVYGGSVKPGNAKELFTQKNIDGALVGGASLKATDFIQIVKAL